MCTATSGGGQSRTCLSRSSRFSSSAWATSLPLFCSSVDLDSLSSSQGFLFSEEHPDWLYIGLRSHLHPFDRLAPACTGLEGQSKKCTAVKARPVPQSGFETRCIKGLVAWYPFLPSPTSSPLYSTGHSFLTPSHSTRITDPIPRPL